MRAQALLATLNAKMQNECACTLRAEATQAVLGEGNASAQLLLIGEAPGKKEDQTGRPFVGAAGQLLNTMLSTIGLKREDIYITNIVKYRPPNNRDPSPKEISDCQEWLNQEIMIIRPQIIVTLGRHALAHFVPEKKISEAHGKIFHTTFQTIGTQTVFALYHPAAALYNGSLRATLLEDFKKIPQVLEQIKNRLP